MRRVSVLVALLAAAGIAGCKGSDSTSTSVSAPGPSTLAPFGTIQGRLTDRVTNQPVVGAVLSIGLAAAATDANGQFVIPNVPATRDALNSSVTGSYLITIDLQRVSSPVAMGSNPAIAYPKFAYASANVVYTSLDDTNGTQPGAGSGSNHDTPVVGLVASVDLDVAKLAAAFTGVVYGCDTAPAVLSQTPVGAGYIVRLFDHGDSLNSGSGADQYVVAVTSTDANGAFSFSNVESLKAFDFETQDALRTFYDRVNNIGSLADGLTQPVKLYACTTDNVGPMVVAISPEPGADVTPATTTVVTFTFNEAIKQTSLTSTIAGIPGNLYEKIQVYHAGDKAGNVAYTLAWDESRTHLSVTFATAPSGKYYIRLVNMGGGILTDSNLNPATIGMCPDDTVAAAAGYTIVGGADADANDCTAYFSTSGAPNASAPTNLVVLNASTLDATATTPHLDWLPAVGAKAYNVYLQCFQWPTYPVGATGSVGANAEAGTQTLLTNVPIATTEYTPGAPLPLIEGDSIPLACTYTVKGVNSDKIENPVGVSVNVSDKVAPRISSAAMPVTTNPPNQLYTDASNQLTVTFNEAMTEAAAETLANWTFTARPGGTTAGELWPTPVASSVQYAGGVATFTFSQLAYAIVPTSGVCPAGLTPATGDTTVITANTPTCIAVGANGTLESTIAATDVACGTGICAGADRVCDSTVLGGSDDVAVTRTGGIPRCVVSGTAGGILATAAPAGTVIMSSIAGVAAGAAITDVAGNPINPNFDTVRVTPVGVVTVGP
jgi:hypothetical protein